MPLLKQQIVLEAARSLKAFLNIEAGLTCGELPPDREQLAARVQGLNQRLNGAQERSKERDEQLKRARRQIENKDQKIAELQRKLDASSARAREAIIPKGEIDEIVARFHKLYYDSGGTWRDTYWLGIPTLKCPLDMWVYQEIVFDLEPDVIIETGTAFGGSALFLACVCDRVGKGNIVTVDIEERKGRPQHERIRYLHGSSTDEDIINRVRQSVTDDSEVLVILDSDHSRDHVLDELRIYSGFAREGNYVIVEDTNVNGHPVLPEFGPGPMEAIRDFLQENEDFVVDEGKEKFYMTFNPKGYLRRTR